MLRMKYIVTLSLVALLMASGAAFAGPWVALEYLTPLTPTSVPLPTDLTVPMFNDVDAPSDAHWAWGEIEECAATHTASSDFIVQGYGDDSYQPSWQVTRGQMAVFIARAAGLPTGPGSVSFQDVPESYWAYAEIEQCVAADIVQGYADFFGDGLDAYLPQTIVDRGQMAVYIGRAAFGTTSGFYADAFPDVASDYWAADWIQECADANIVQGFPDGKYLPDVKVTRAQMAVFVWRGLVRDDGDVVLGGPEAADNAWLDTAEGAAKLFLPADVVGTTGANTVDVGPDTVVYVALDAAQIGDGSVDFELSDSGGSLDTETLPVTAAAGETDVNAASGVPYYVASYHIESGLADEDYTLTITLPNGNVQTLEFSVPPAE